MVDLIPRSVLFGNPERTSPEISPDGGSLAWIAPDEGVLNLWVAPIDSGVDWAAARVVTEDRDRGVRAYAWARDGRHLLYIQDVGGDENWRLYDVDPQTLERRDLTPFEKIHATIIGTSKRRPTEVLVGLNADNPQLHDVYRLDLVSGALVKEIENPGYAGWVADEDLVVRCAIAPLPDGSFNVLIRESAADQFRHLLTIPAEDATSTDVVSFSGDGRSLLMISAAGTDTGRLTRVDLATGDSAVLFEDAEADVAGVLLHPDTRDPQIVSVLKDRMTYAVLDPSVEDDLKAVRALHPGDPSFSGRDEADTTWLIAFNVDAGSVTYFMFDRAAKSGRLLFEARPALSGYELAAMEPFAFTARDGLVVHGYATFPPGLGRENLPAVVNVHGGPQVRDAWGYNPEAQWLANRGYLCVQVNYRGSTGYGKAFVAAGDREWGGKMHDDLIDAVDYVVSKGWADRSKVAIYGGSYGGYAALVGAAFTPDVFCCAVDIVGPSNLKTLLETIPPYWAPMIAQLYRRVGNPETDQEFLWSRSPLSRAHDIRIPLLIAQGANDPRVKQAESEQIVAALTEAGIDHEYLLFPDEGHGFAKPENRIKFYTAAEKFLARYLGGRHEE
ncbi:S9 family peptidase [Trebonia kvetii]|uniref:S9 family peptidase n=1 Tax=Trebonia kvetii TaxID=2480626 RepID=A0A6P2BQW2_9ACTN|nr:S9 family peptidase [Trebonia kvetii]TVZ00586.1 S9 family peptidase [Trebonia kvetii]